MPLLTNKPYLSGEMQFCSHHPTIPPTMADIKPGPDTAEPDLPPSYDETNAAAAPLPQRSKPPPQQPLLRPPLPLEIPALAALRGKRIILASASPRRKQLLAQIGLSNLETIPCPLPENLPKSLSPLEYVLGTARRKCMHVYSQEINNTVLGEPTLVLSADTIVVSSTTSSPSLTGGTTIIHEKPSSESHHISMLKSLARCGADGGGGTHKVYTAIVAMSPLLSARDPGYALESHVEETGVVFANDITDEEILAYVRTREGADKAGGYALQGAGVFLVDRVEGSWDNVVGLPVRAMVRLIGKVMRRREDEEGVVEEEGEEEEGENDG